jgi:acetylornithine deacetylase/succinyl-diaminopimelate desuccinylase-like protein
MSDSTRTDDSTSTDAALASVLDCVDRNLDDAIARLRDLLSIPSISTDPQYRQDVRRAAQWLVRQFQTLGLATELVETSGHPVVLDRSVWPQVERIAGDQGYGGGGVTIPVDGRNPDVNTLRDLRALEDSPDAAMPT